MNRLVFVLICVLAFCFSCEEDDICIENTTPRLYISFDRNKINQESDSLIIYRQNSKGDFDLVQKGLILDSVFVALPVEKQNQTKLIIGKSSYDIESQDTLTIQYDYHLRFVSKACGYGVQYLNTNYQLTNHYFNSFETLQNEITNENSAHIRLHY